MFAYCQSNMVVTGSNTNWNENFSANKHPLSENKICVMWFYLYDWLKTINKPISHNIHPRQFISHAESKRRYNESTMLQHLLVFKWIWFSVWRKKKKLLPMNSNQYFSIHFTFFIHKESYLQLIMGKTSSRTIHMLDYKQICTMECAYLNWAAEHNFGINNAYHVQLFEYLCAVEMQINDLWLKTFSIKRFLIWWKSWFIILNQKRDAFWKERRVLKREMRSEKSDKDADEARILLIFWNVWCASKIECAIFV